MRIIRWLGRRMEQFLSWQPIPGWGTPEADRLVAEALRDSADPWSRGLPLPRRSPEIPPEGE